METDIAKLITTVDVANAGVEFIAIVSALADIRQLVIDKEVKGFNVWMLVYWWIYGAWETYVAWAVKLPVTAVVIALWMLVYIGKVILSFHYKFRSVKS